MPDEETHRAELVAALREAVAALWEVRLDATKYDENDAVIERGRAILRQIDGADTGKLES